MKRMMHTLLGMIGLFFAANSFAMSQFPDQENCIAQYLTQVQTNTSQTTGCTLNTSPFNLSLSRLDYAASFLLPASTVCWPSPLGPCKADSLEPLPNVGNKPLPATTPALPTSTPDFNTGIAVVPTDSQTQDSAHSSTGHTEVQDFDRGY